jgi:hypothetical protein
LFDLNQPNCEADHSTPASADVKNVWIFTSPSAVLHHANLRSFAIQAYWHAFVVDGFMLET